MTALAHPVRFIAAAFATAAALAVLGRALTP